MLVFYISSKKREILLIFLIFLLFFAIFSHFLLIFWFLHIYTIFSFHYNWVFNYLISRLNIHFQELDSRGMACLVYWLLNFCYTSYLLRNTSNFISDSSHNSRLLFLKALIISLGIPVCSAINFIFSPLHFSTSFPLTLSWVMFSIC